MTGNNKDMLETKDQWRVELEKQADKQFQAENLQVLDEKGVRATIANIARSPSKYQGTRFVYEISNGIFRVDLSNIIFEEDFSETVSKEQQTSIYDFSNSIMKGDFTFNLNCNNVEILAIGAKFKQKCLFKPTSDSRRFGVMNFIKAEFGNKTLSENKDFEASFIHSIFNNDCCFPEAKFYCDAIFSEAVFDHSTWFDEAEFYGLALFSGNEIRSNGKISFKGTKFFSDQHTPAFDNRIFSAPITFEKAVFTLPPEFNNTKLHHSADFREAKFINTEFTSASYYRILKLLMEEARNYPMEGRFHALEEACLKKNEYAGILEKIASNLYSKIAEYGQNFLRPLLFLFIIQICAFIGYMYFLPNVKFKESLSVTLDQLFKPVTSLNKYACAMPDTNLLIMKIISLFHFILSISLITLFLLALRRRFRLR